MKQAEIVFIAALIGRQPQRGRDLLRDACSMMQQRAGSALLGDIKLKLARREPAPRTASERMK